MDVSAYREPLDSIRELIQSLPDTTYQAKLDSIKKMTQSRFDAGIVHLNKAIDSLNSIVNSPLDYKYKIDELYSKFDSTFIAPLKMKGDSLQSEFKERVHKIQSHMEEKKRVLDSILTANQLTPIADLKLDTKIPNSLQGLNSITAPSLEGFTMPALDNVNLTIPDLSMDLRLDALDDITQSVDQVGELTSEVNGYTDELNAIKKDVKRDKLTERFESELLKVTGGEKIKSSSDAVTGLKDQLENMTEVMKDEKKLQEELKKQSKKQFVDHFAGHEEKIQSEIESMEKLQRKYHSVADVRYLPKRRTNPEKDKPFIERLIIGTSFQIDRDDPKWTDMDISPYLGYNFSNLFRMAIGGTYRVTFDPKTFEFSHQNEIFGLRTFVNRRIFNGWYGHLEVEALQTKNGYVAVPTSVGKTASDENWYPMAHAGILKTFGITKHFQGQTQVLYNFFNPDEEFKFNFEKFGLRFGFEYKIIRKKK